MGSSVPSHDRDASDAAPWEGMSARRYLATRISTLRPPMVAMANPWRLLRMLNAQQWSFFGLAFFAWTWDAFDFFSVSLTVSSLSKTFDKSKTDITWGITLVLMFRSIGSVVFGIAADRYGRKWPFIANNLLFILLELGTGFCNTYQQFLACRALFGIAMGGLYGNAAATALEDCPEQARGLMSGILQQGYAFGYLLCAAFARALVNTTPHGWRPLYWFGACPPVLFIAWRLLMPETANYRERERMRNEARLGGGGGRRSAGSVFIGEGKLSPGAFRTFVVGTSYQLGNLVSSASSTIEARLGEGFPLPPTTEGVKRYEYGKVICIFMACVYVYTIALTVVGPEHLHRKLDVAHDEHAETVVGADAAMGHRSLEDSRAETHRVDEDEEKRP
ncbi:sugar transporter family protein [Ophiocordyceps sinensis CO18]|uniref:Sugar transporter family protein n=1 Tax=Ophiocordyceps sinensis (strain Co18 / CGMCC 3.14243) TaxID=911162 RepID=T5A5S1_OPHSC|nr:sugar transporter family protein [Ophiocordyceps sinensis CO18]